MIENHLLEPGCVAVVTGAALGIGQALSYQLAQAGVSVVMADLPSKELDEACKRVGSATDGNASSVVAIPTDLSRTEHIQKLHDSTLARFGRIDFLVNNAVTRTGRGINADLNEWRAAMEVNLWGPVSTVRTFLPSLLASKSRSYIVNVGSKQGITNPPGHPIYNMSKSALKTYTEALEHELRSDPSNQQSATRLSAHLLVPGWTTTGHAEHKPGAWLPNQVVERLFLGLQANDFYIICPDDEVTTAMDNKRILWAAQDMTENRPALSRWHPDYADKAKLAGC